MPSEIVKLADFSRIRYAQCWEDADVLLQGLAIQPDDVCLSIGSAGDNTLALLACSPKRVIAVDFNPAQIACLALRVAAFRVLSHGELLAFLGSKLATGGERRAFYGRCRGLLDEAVRQFWDGQERAIAQGFARVGKFERYLTTFRKYVLPLIGDRTTREHFLQNHPQSVREAFYQTHWNHWRWRLLFRLFFSRPLLGRWGRDPQFFRYGEGAISQHLLQRTEYALTQLNPAENPYLQWILTGYHPQALPFALRPENFDPIRDHLNRLEWHNSALEDFLSQNPHLSINRYNLSNIFEYMSPDNSQKLLQQIIQQSPPGSRLLYWNLFVPRCRPDSLAADLRPLSDLANTLFQQDKAFFYQALVIEEKVP
ncbi:BtaA family protein [Spirulina subsalsa FACHB-351]|uniref:BtaA family protein n=1 Tax=Spirulina subsalsa FACHB-351 TaxID=234711 RepID=A0ABT3L1X2_9CYAN|nr:BtaA family protein [Spirulina subsalsa]MCW6035491.1 BtaA family protein [Spirulina subsalsa FACHB-351]